MCEWWGFGDGCVDGGCTVKELEVECVWVGVLWGRKALRWGRQGTRGNQNHTFLYISDFLTSLLLSLMLTFCWVGFSYFLAIKSYCCVFISPANNSSSVTAWLDFSCGRCCPIFLSFPSVHLGFILSGPSPRLWSIQRLRSVALTYTGCFLSHISAWHSSRDPT